MVTERSHRFEANVNTNTTEFVMATRTQRCIVVACECVVLSDYLFLLRTRYVHIYYLCRHQTAKII